MQIEAPCGLQNAVQFQEPVGHHHQVGHHVVFAQELAEGPHHFRRSGVGLVQQLVEFLLRLVPPVPSVLESGDLGVRVMAVGGLEQHVVGGLGVERRVQVDEIHARGRDAFPQDSEIVAKVELVHFRFSMYFWQYS